MTCFSKGSTFSPDTGATYRALHVHSSGDSIHAEKRSEWFKHDRLGFNRFTVFLQV